MLALREIQVRFAAALFEGEIAPIEPHIVSDGIRGGGRLDIYRNNLREGFIKALALGFPVIERLVGEAYFRHLAFEFLSAHPSRSGNLHHIGAPLAAFLRQRFAHTEYAYLVDVAALEWAHQEALIAVQREPISADALRDVDPSSYESLQFDLHPACGLVQSQYPIVQIWRTNQPEASGDDIVDLAGGGDNVLVLRAPECIEFHRLPAGEYATLAAFSRGENLGAACEAAQAADPTFDLGAALRRFLTLRIVTGLHLPTPAT
jgi:hypothetical protein